MFGLARASRPDKGPLEPYRSQSMAIISDKAHHETDQQRKSTSRSTRSFRHSIHSAVPDTSFTTLAKRPDRGGIGMYL